MVDEDARAAQSRWATWLTGGLLLVGTSLIQLVGGRAPEIGIAPFATVSFAAAMVVFAWGVRRPGSIVGRRPLGVVALVVFGIWPIVVLLFQASALSPSGALSTADTLSASDSTIGVFLIIGYVQLVVLVGAAIVASIQIGRARVLPPRARWLPMWALALLVAMEVAIQLAGMAARGDQTFVSLLITLNELARFVVTLGLGGVAILLALFAAPRPEPTGDSTVHIYPPRRSDRP